MTRFIVIGTSHVGGLKVAWDQMAADHPGVEMEFFASPGRSFRRFRLLDGLRFGLPDGEGEGAIFGAKGQTSIDLATADMVVWGGQYWPWDELAALMESFDIDGLRQAGGEQALSRRAFDAFCETLAEQIAPPAVWHNWTRPRFALIPAPMRSVACIDAPGGRFRGFRFLAKRPAGGREVILAFMDIFARSLQRIGIEMIGQPPETFLPNGLTDLPYSRNGRGILVEGPTHDDMTHMNAEYGKLQLRAVISRFADARPASPEPAAAS